MSKRATILATTVQVSCPDCQQPLPVPIVGSFMWTLDDLKNYAGALRTCDCGTSVRLPDNAPKSVRVL